MQLKKTFLTLLFLALFAVPAFAQDAGTPDTIDLVVLLNPDANANQLKVELQLWVYNDAELQAATMGFSWDNSNLQLDSAVATPLTNGGFGIGPFFFEGNSIATTNTNQRFLFGGIAIFPLFSGDAAARRLWATYYFTLSNWTTSDEINIDTLEFNDASAFQFVSGIAETYIPNWTGALKITDPNAPVPTIDLIVSPDTVSGTAVEAGANPSPDSVDVTEAGGGNIGFTVSELISWASVSPLSGTTPDELVVTYNISGLAPGNYFDSIAVVSGEADNSPQYIFVSLQVNAVEKFLAVSPDTLLFTALESGANPPPVSFLVSETGAFNINFSLSESSDWLSLNKTGGTTDESVIASADITALAPGTYFDSVQVSSGDAANSPIYVYAKLDVLMVNKFLAVSPDTLSFSAVEAGANPADQSFTVSETGEFNIAFSVSESSAWLSLNKSGGTTTEDVTVSVNISGLAPGAYLDSVMISSGAANNSPIYEYVSLVVATADKFLAVSPGTLSFSAVEAGVNPADQSFTVSETGAFNIAFTVSESSLWLSLDKSGGTTTEDVTVSVNISGLSPGTYFDSVQVSSGAASNSPIYEYVSFEVFAADKSLALVPDTLSFSAVEGGANPADLSFTVSETGAFNISFALTENISWLSLNKTGGTTAEAVDVSIDISGLAPGTYFDSVMVSSAAANNSPIYEYVSLEVIRADKFLAVAPDTLVFNAVAGGGSPVAQSFDVSETGGFNINFTLAENSSWLSLNKTGGTTPDIVEVSVDVTGLVVDNHYANITVASGDANNSPQIVTVKFVVTAAPILLEVAPTSINLVVTDGGAAFDPVSVSVSDSAGGIWPYTVSENSFWFNTSKSSGTAPDNFLVVADTTNLDSLPPGTYADTIVVSADTAFNSPVIVIVSLEILEKPNTPPVLDAIADTTIFEGETLIIGVSASDADGDTLYLSVATLVDNMTFIDSGNGNGQFRFTPNFSQAGVYNLTAHASDGKDTVSESFTITVEDKDPGSEGDTLVVATVPAVPGQQIPVPLTITNSCDVYGIIIPIDWDGGSSIVLDSFIFDEALSGLAIKNVDIDNINNNVFISAQVSDGPPIVPGTYALGNLYFSIDCFTPLGVYGVTPVISFLKADTAHPSTFFLRDCGGGEGQQNILPVIPGGGGNIIVDITESFVCGYIISPDTVGIAGATVELWPDYPSSGPTMTTTTNGNGAFAFTDFFLGSFDLYAYKGSSDSTTFNGACYPNDTTVNSGKIGVMIILYPVEPITPVDQWVDYFCDVNTLFGSPLPVGAIVEAQDPQGNICGRQFVTDPGVYKFMPVYRDSTGSSEDEGATTGDNIRFFINGVAALADGNTIYPDAYDTVRVCLAGGERLTLECTLNPGWNLVSWNLNTDSDDIEDVLASLGCIGVVLGFEQGGLTYVPGMDIFNTLHTVDHLSGYWIKIDTSGPAQVCYIPFTLEISGVPVDQDTPILLNSGWNLVSYLPNDTLPTDSALASLGSLEIAYTFDSAPLIYIPGDSLFNTLNFMEPCFGYWLKSGSDDVLTYPSASGLATPEYDIENLLASAKTVEKVVEPTRSWVNLYSYNLTLDNMTVPAGAIVTARSADGVKIGHFELSEHGQFGFMPVYADLYGEQVTGISKGDVFFLEIDGERTREEFSWTDQGALIEVAALTTGGSPDDNLPGSYSLSQNYPNPFNPSTTINFSLPAAGQARIEIFNLLGQVVAIPFDGMADAGETKVIWDGRTLSGETAASGIYLYRLTADNRQIETKKMTLLK
ncbi:MAG: T9SS type A sorting domain-containing protein [candidate division Zixibacteria bacterium]|nr:T9SS type A sorting domain-containing protein [candidate division Zixibacteria bacterium]